MNGHGATNTDDRQTGIDDVRQEIQGKLPKGAFEFSSDASLGFSDISVADGDPLVKKMFKLALKRDAAYASAGAVYLRAFGLNQAIREIYDGGRQLINNGAKK